MTVAAGSCSSAGDDVGGSTGGATTSTVTEQPSTSITSIPVGSTDRETTTTEPPADLPAGAQFVAPPTTSPGIPIAAASLGDLHVGVTHDSMAIVGSDELEAIALPQLPAPAGFPLPEGPTHSSAIAAASSGFVAVGTARFRVSPSGSYTYRSALWHSTDGRTWQLTETASIVGPDASTALRSVASTPSGFVAVGAIGAASGPATSSALILSSPDGITWTRAAAPERTWSLGLHGVGAVGGSIVIAGSEFVCADDGGALAYTGASGLQTRLWTSADGLQTWNDVDLGPTGLPRGAEAPPTDAASCPAGADGNQLRLERDERFGDVVALTFTGGAVVATDGDAVAVTEDLSTWRTSEIDDFLPRPNEEGREPPEPVAEIVTATDGDLLYLTIQRPRDANGREVLGRGHAPLAWRSHDGGATWERVPAAGRTILLGSAPPSMLAVGERVEVYTEYPPDSGGILRWVSTAGPPTRWQCAPAPTADCLLADLRGEDLAGLDLTGADLRGATLTDTDVTGATLAGARLEGASLIAASVGGANLSNANLSGAFVETSLFTDGAVLEGAALTGIKVRLGNPDAPTALSIAGFDLTRASFTGDTDQPAPLTFTNATGANLTRAIFTGVDLSGSNLGGATLDDVIFLKVVCPDGQPSQEGVAGAAACRL